MAGGKLRFDAVVGRDPKLAALFKHVPQAPQLHVPGAGERIDDPPVGAPRARSRSKAEVLRESSTLVIGRIVRAAGRIAQVDFGPPLLQRTRRFKKLARGDRHRFGLQ